MVEQQPECLGADRSRADRLMPVDPGAERFLRVVGMDDHQAVEADQAVELRQRGVEGGRRSERIPGGEHVAGVEADPDPPPQSGVVGAGDDRADLLETGPQATPLASGGLHEHARSEGPGALECRDKPVGGAPDGHVGLLPGGGARMGDHPGDAEQLGTLELVHEGIEGSVAEGVVGRGRVDQVGVVGHHQPQAGRSHRRAKCGGRPGVQRRVVPAVDVPGEHLEAFAAGLDRPLHGLGRAPGDRLVGPEKTPRSGGG